MDNGSTNTKEGGNPAEKDKPRSRTGLLKTLLGLFKRNKAFRNLVVVFRNTDKHFKKKLSGFRNKDSKIRTTFIVYRNKKKDEDLNG